MSAATRQFGVFAVTAIVVGGIVYAATRPAPNGDAPAGFDDLEPCTTLTSLDGKRSLRLSRNHSAAFSDSSGFDIQTASGSWSLVDDDRHVYRVTLDGVSTDYTLASAPAGEGCMLAAGHLNAADLDKSWFSTMTDPD